jgi:hypothetical protein
MKEQLAGITRHIHHVTHYAALCALKRQGNANCDAELFLKVDVYYDFMHFYSYTKCK